MNSLLNKSTGGSFRIDGLPRYVLGEIARAVIEGRSAGQEIIDLSQINPGSGVPGAALDRLVQSALRPHSHQYSSSQGIRKLRETCAEWYERDFGVKLDPGAQIAATMGIKEGLGHLLLATARPGDTVVLPTPSYPVHSAAVSIASAGMVGVSLFDQPLDSLSPTLDENSSGFFERLEQACDRTWPRPHAVIVSFPHNPTAAVVTPGFFERLIRTAERHDIFVIHDFAYADLFLDDYRPPSILSAPGAMERAVEFRSLSKSHGLAGWRIGFCAGNARLIDALKRLKSYLDFGIFQPLQLGAVEAILDQEFVEEVRSNYASRRDVIVGGLREIGWELESPKAGVFVWARLPESLRQHGSLEASRIMLAEAGVAVCPGEGFDPSMQEFVRFSLGVPEAKLRKAVENLARLGELQ
ncbi:MAG: aminotransferase class I/II-fold pyridoxal phosphate-dependent enzyme [Bdellovibrionales bacterium]|nr:aminotransferase class I/II-fold pyridoxal phosphate-dependent enzyme [Bdellovibrionales bacterium]